MKKPVELADFTQYNFLSDVNLSPDGSRAVFVKAKAKADLGGYDYDLCLLDVKTGAVKQLTHYGIDKAPIWDDNDTILFPSVRTDAERVMKEKGYPMTTYYRLKVDGDLPEAAFTVPVNSGKLTKLADGRYAMVAIVDLCLPDLSELSPREKDAALKSYFDSKKDYEIFDEIPFFFTIKGRIHRKRQTVFVYDENTRELTQASPSFLETEGMKANADGTRLVFHGYLYDSVRPDDQVIFTYDVMTGERQEVLTAKPTAVHFMGDKLLMFSTWNVPKGEERNPSFYLVDPVSKAVAPYCDFDSVIHGTITGDSRLGMGFQSKVVGDRVYFITPRMNDAYLATVENNELKLITRSVGSADYFDIVGDTCVLGGMLHTRLQELYRVDLTTGEETQLTRLNQEYMGTHTTVVPKELTFVNSAGDTIYGWVLLPPDFDEAKKYKGMLQIHGGPKNSYGTIYVHEMQYFANQGYVVFFCNPTGSEGRGIKFADMFDKYGTQDYADLMQFTDEVLKAYPQIDEKNVVVAGGSYGGFMTNWIIGHTDRFRAACAQRGIANWISKSLASDGGWLSRRHGGTVWEAPEKVWEHSPLKYADKVVTPTLIVHSDQDYRCYHAEGLQMFEAIKAHGVDARMIFFHGESHELSRSGKPRNRIKRLSVMDDWFRTHTDEVK